MGTIQHKYYLKMFFSDESEMAMRQLAVEHNLFLRPYKGAPVSQPQRAFKPDGLTLFLVLSQFVWVASLVTP